MPRMTKSKRSRSAQRPLFVIILPKGAMPKADIDQVKSDFDSKGMDLIPVVFNNNSPVPPRVERVFVP